MSLYEVVGVESDDRAFVMHLGLSAFVGRHSSPTLPCCDMGPPLHGFRERARLRASVIGRANLSFDEEMMIKDFIDRLELEHSMFSQLTRRQIRRFAPKMYCIYPHVDPPREQDDRYSRIRFSCAGFVFEAYRACGITLVDVATLPPVDIDTVVNVYRNQIKFLMTGEDHCDPITVRDLGLQGDGPWPIMLCGYLLNSLKRAPDEIRNSLFAAQASDSRFV